MESPEAAVNAPETQRRLAQGLGAALGAGVLLIVVSWFVPSARAQLQLLACAAIVVAPGLSLAWMSRRLGNRWALGGFLMVLVGLALGLAM